MTVIKEFYALNSASLIADLISIRTAVYIHIYKRRHGDEGDFSLSLCASRRHAHHLHIKFGVHLSHMLTTYLIRRYIIA